jgi:hypothetical protein
MVSHNIKSKTSYRQALEDKHNNNNNKIKEEEKGMACNTHGREKKYIQSFGIKREEKRN